MKATGKSSNARPAVECLEQRIAPVIGNGVGPPDPIPWGEFAHVVLTQSANGSVGSGALLRTQRHVLAVAHTIDGSATSVRFDMVRNRGGIARPVPITFVLPPDAAMNQWQIRHPGYIPPEMRGNRFAANDIGIFRLTDPVNPAPDRYVIAPVGLNNLRGYRISSADPAALGLYTTFVGYGATGIGNWGNSSQAVQRLEIRNIPGGGAGGNFTLSFVRPDGGAPQVTANINTNGLTAAALATALEGLPALASIPGQGGQPPIRQVEVWQQDSPANGLDFAIRFIGPILSGRGIPLMSANVGAGQGNFAVTPIQVWPGGSFPNKRTGNNTIDQVFPLDADYVEADFDNGIAANNAIPTSDLGIAGEAGLGQGDSGGPAFWRNPFELLDDPLEIIGVNQSIRRTTTPPDINNWVFANGVPGLPDGSFGEFSVFTQVRNFNNPGGFIDTTINNQPYDLILDMNKQVIGADLPGEKVTITARRLMGNGDLVLEVVEPLNAYSGEYFRVPAAQINQIRSLTIRGSADDETFNLQNDLLGGRPVIIEASAGNDRVNMTRMGVPNPDSFVFEGGDGDDSLVVTDDTTMSETAWILNGTTIDITGDPQMTYTGFEHVTLNSGPGTDLVTVAGLDAGVQALIQSGEADDKVMFNLASPLPADAQVELNGGAGYDRLIVGAGQISTPAVGVAEMESLEITGGTLQLGKPLAIADFTLSAGVLGGSADLTVSHTGSWTGGTMSGTGATNIAVGATLSIGDGSAPVAIMDRTLKIAGNATWTGSDIQGSTGKIRDLSGGRFAARGHLYGQLTNEGELLPGGIAAVGVVHVDGGFSQSAGGGG